MKKSFFSIRRILLLGLSLIAIYLVCSPRVLPGLYTHRLFLTDREIGNPADLANFRDVPNSGTMIPSGPAKTDHIRIWHFDHRGPQHNNKKVYLICPGNAGDIPRRISFVRRLLATGASVVTYEPRGYGKSQGKPSTQHIMQDGEAAFAWVIDSLGYAPSDVIVYGVSLGCTVAVHLADTRSFDRLVLQSGFASLPAIAHEKVPFLRIYPSWLFPRDPSLDNAQILKRIHKPLLIMHGGRDNIIDPWHSRYMYACSASRNKRFQLIAHSDHVSVDERDSITFARTLIDFVAKP